MQLLFMQVDTLAAGQPHLSCNPAFGIVPPQQVSQQAKCSPEWPQLRWLRRAARTPRQRADRAQQGQENQPPQAAAASTQPQQAQPQSQAPQGRDSRSFTGVSTTLSNSRPHAEQPQQPHQVGSP